MKAQTSTGKTAIGCLFLFVMFFVLVAACGALLSDEPDAPEPSPTVTKTQTVTPSVNAEETAPDTPTTEAEVPAEATTEAAVPDPAFTYDNCSAVREAGAAPIHRGDPGWHDGLDWDGDGQACAWD